MVSERVGAMAEDLETGVAAVVRMATAAVRRRKSWQAKRPRHYEVHHKRCEKEARQNAASCGHYLEPQQIHSFGSACDPP